MSHNSWKVEYVSANAKGCSYSVPVRSMHRPACRAILSGSFYEPKTHELIKEIYRHFSGNLIHAGVFFGDMLPSFSDCVGAKGLVYAFEPVLESYVLARLCVQENNLKNIVLLNSALSDQAGSLTIVTDAGKRGGASLIGSGQGGDQIISALCVDSFCINNLLCLHLDVEGHELQALKGSLQTIQRSKPIVLIEDNGNNCNDFMEQCGYICIGRVPGLKAWVHKSDERFREALAGLPSGFFEA